MSVSASTDTRGSSARCSPSPMPTLSSMVAAASAEIVGTNPNLLAKESMSDSMSARALPAAVAIATRISSLCRERTASSSSSNVHRWSPMVVSAQSCTAVRLASMESWSVMVAAISAIFVNRMRCRTSRHGSSLLTKLE